MTLAPQAAPPGSLRGPDADLLRRLAEAGLRTVRDVLAAAEGVRDLPRRANYRLSAAGLRLFVKREKPRGRAPRDSGALPREARGIARLEAAGLPTARLAFVGVDPDLGAVTGTVDVAPARPLDAVLRDGGPAGPVRRRLLVALASHAAALHGAGLHHRDLYLNHVYADPDPADPRLVFLDLERVGPHRRTWSRRVVKDLAALLSSVPSGTVSGAERLRFLATYLRARGLRARAERDRVARRLGRRVARKAARIRAHAPRTPVGAAAPRPAPVRPA